MPQKVYHFLHLNFLPDEDVLLLAHSLSEWLSQGHLCKVLEGGVDGVPDGLIEHALHPAHQNLKTLDHSNDLHQGKLLLAGVVVTGSAFILLSCAGTVFITEFISWVDQFPRVLEEVKKNEMHDKWTTETLMKTVCTISNVPLP